jgi:hypothetical protein
LPNSRRSSGAPNLHEKRTRKRTALSLTGKLFIPACSIEDDCTVLDMSATGAGIKSSISAPIGTRLVLYVEPFGRFEGKIVDRHRVRLGVEFLSNSAKRDWTEEQLAHFETHGTTSRLHFRSAVRVKEFPPLEQFSTADGLQTYCELIDISVGGALFRTRARPVIGEVLNFGVTCARVVRHTGDGIAVEFVGRLP